jgi:hypothetical protein
MVTEIGYRESARVVSVTTEAGMAVSSYRIAHGQTRWLYVIDLPPGVDGKRRQQKRRGFLNAAAALKAETEAKAAYGSAELAADGTVAAELDGWLAERELDVEPTTLSSYRDVVRCCGLAASRTVRVPKTLSAQVMRHVRTRGGRRRDDHVYGCRGG